MNRSNLVRRQWQHMNHAFQELLEGSATPNE